MGTVEILMERELLILKQEYVKEKLSEIYNELNDMNVSRDAITEEVFQVLADINDRNKVWRQK